MSQLGLFTDPAGELVVVDAGNGHVTPEQAREAGARLIANAFGGREAKLSQPARSDDDDLVVARFIKQQSTLRRATEAECKAFLESRGWRVRPPKPPIAPHVAGSDTSKAAAEAILPHVGTLQAKVLALFDASFHNGLTCDQVEVELNGRHQTISARVYELKNKRLIVASGRRRKTRSGRQAAVYVRTDLGR